MALSPVAIATFRGVTWRFVANGNYYRGARLNADGVAVKAKTFTSRPQLQNYLQWLQRHGWRVQFTGVMPARPVRVSA